jgi:hypothetical protein
MTFILRASCMEQLMVMDLSGRRVQGIAVLALKLGRLTLGRGLHRATQFRHFTADLSIHC